MKGFLEKKLKLKINPKKSKVERAGKVKILGFSFFKRKGIVLIRIANRTKERFMEKLRALTKRTRGGKLEGILEEINGYVIGWTGYYRLADTPSLFEELDSWIRRRLRQLVWKRWKRGATRYRELVKLGVPRRWAQEGAGGKSPWRMSATPVINQALSNTDWQNSGLISMKERYQKLRFA